MKKYIYLILFIMVTILLKYSNKSYAYEECVYIKEYLNSVNTNNIPMKDNVTYHQFCSYQDCYNMKNNNIKEAVKNFIKLQERKKSEEYILDANIKGIPITEISYTICK